ncbi:alpha-ribazole phosphatase family protein [Candidatus Methylopumilus turicensis]|nr:alpha-ribazole phosphatase family protein [Candidatus Methylopumilus turicensis]
MDIFLVRHTTPKIDSELCYGQSDVGLADSFEAEWLSFRSKIAHLESPLVFSSPLQRCFKLAQKAVTHFDFSEQFIDDRLMELNFGDWELKAWRDIPQGLVGEWTDEHVKQAPPNGESFVELHERAKAFLYDLAKHQNNQQALVFTHAGVIRALVTEALKVPLREASGVEVNYGSVTQIALDAGVTRLEFVNR